MGGRCLILLGFLGLAACQTAPPDPLAFSFETFAPAGAPVSVVVLAPGCGGVSERRDTQPMFPLAEQLRAQGHFVVLADYEAAYGMTHSCQGGAKLEDVANGIVIAAVQGRNESGLGRAGPVALVGWSLGGSGVLLAGDKAGADRVVALYPDCTPFQSLSVHVDYLVMTGDEDRLTPLSECEAIRQSSEATGAEWVVYPGVYHGFDYKGFGRGLSVSGDAFREGFVMVKYDEAAAADAHRRILDFLAR